MVSLQQIHCHGLVFNASLIFAEDVFLLGYQAVTSIVLGQPVQLIVKQSGGESAPPLGGHGSLIHLSGSDGLTPRVKEFKLWFLFTGRMKHGTNRRVGVASGVMQELYWNGVVRKELSREAKPSIYQIIYVPTLTYGLTL